MWMDIPLARSMVGDAFIDVLFLNTKRERIEFVNLREILRYQS